MLFDRPGRDAEYLRYLCIGMAEKTTQNEGPPYRWRQSPQRSGDIVELFVRLQQSRGFPCLVGVASFVKLDVGFAEANTLQTVMIGQYVLRSRLQVRFGIIDGGCDAATILGTEAG